MKHFMIFIALMMVVSCNPAGKSNIKDEIRDVIKSDPTLITDLIKAHPVEFMKAIQEAAGQASQEMAKQQKESEQKKLSAAMDKPFTPQIRSDENILGKKEAPIQVVIYSDFECPYCVRAYDTVKQLISKYGDKIQYIYKHLPLPFHQNAYLAASYYEAVRIQSGTKAWAFHDEILKNQGSLRNGAPFLKDIAKKLGVDMKKLEADIGSDVVKKRIVEDEKEAKELGFEGTPGFLLNGIPIPGALPLSHFESLINELKARNKITL